MVTNPPKLVTKPPTAANLRCDRTIASMARSASECVILATSAIFCAESNEPLPSIPTSIRRSNTPVTPAVALSSGSSTSVLLLTVGSACQHWIMLLADVVRASNQVSRTGSRNSKVSLLADVLRGCALEVVDGMTPADEIGLATRYLSGALRQRRTGIELSWSARSSWSELPSPPDTGVVTLSELDVVTQEASEMAVAGSSRLRSDLFLDLVRKLTAEERTFVIGLLRGGLRQGALESVVMTAVAEAGGVSLVDLRRAVANQGDLAGVAQALLLEGPGVLDHFHLTVGRGVGPMLASSAKTVGEALAKTGPAGVEWKLDGIRAQIHKQGNDIRVLTRSLDDITDRVPEVVDLIRSLPAARAIFDGELIALHSNGRPKPFQETGSRTASRVEPEVARARTPLTAYLFDVLHLDGVDLIDEPNRVRRAALESAVPPAPVSYTHLT